MAITLRQNLQIALYVIQQRLRGRDKFPLVLQLEPLYQCNLACAGCGKIQHPQDILARRLSVQQCIDAVEECGAPIVSIAGGEPLIHREIGQIVTALLERKRFVYLCTNAILMSKKLDQFRPSPYFSWSIHIDGLRERHDQSVDRQGVFDQAIEAIEEAQRRGFRVTTNTTFFAQDNASSIRAVLDFLNNEVQVDAMQISPGYAYEKAPDQEHFLGVERTHQIFRQAFAGGKRKRWRLNHSPLFLDFLEGKVDFACTAWGIPSYSVLGWQRPCYLLADGYASSYRELIETTQWEQYGRGKDPRCANCMAHCGYEPSAVIATMQSPRESLRATVDVLRGNIRLGRNLKRRRARADG
ncbi:MAG TPA: adenosyl-hopene transferase HpnH [Ktedonosporobacter sp.]|jgi:hopanoid biosynthesis associated radical SAM protein HpnH|nr:adenosyl-hopene transferase HpnH [Ktedonosporobacter sp.]